MDAKVGWPGLETGFNCRLTSRRPAFLKLGGQDFGELSRAAAYLRAIRVSVPSLKTVISTVPSLKR
jgi:hypothetical protein